jgi:hypothetical protein
MEGGLEMPAFNPLLTRRGHIETHLTPRAYEGQYVKVLKWKILLKIYDMTTTKYINTSL